MNARDAGSRIPAPGEGKRGEAGRLGDLLRQAAGAYRLRLERALADLEVTHPQFAVLTMLAACPGLSNADLARLALLTPQTVSVIVANLDRVGAVVRRPDDVHGRIVRLTLSTSGRRLLARCRARAQVVEAEFASMLTAKTQTTVRRWLVEVAAGPTSRRPSRGRRGASS